MTSPFQIITSNGFARYNLADASAELASRGCLARLMTGAYPTGMAWRSAERLGVTKQRKLARLAARGVDVPPSRIDALWTTEAVHASGMVLRRLPAAFHRLADWLDIAGYRLYGRQAARIIASADTSVPTIYHYRSGFGQESVACARARGMIVLCEHTIAHPRLVDYLTRHGGRFPPPGARPAPSRFWHHILDDVERAEHVVVNSDFVRQTFLHQGWPEDRVHVVYSGVDQPCLDQLPQRRPVTGQPMRLLFTGGHDPRKGIDVLINALFGLDDIPWRLDIVAGVHPDAKQRFSNFLADPRVRVYDLVPRSELTARLTASDIFVFPSLAEGSARVVFEALACGCFVITTPNSGSIVEHDRHGFLVPPGDAEALRAALRRAFAMGRDRLAAAGAANAALIRTDYNQHRYGDRLTALYERLLAMHASFP
ncbi:glycosyltransferase involved in cell wall biosynthesis [Azospirillum fermentarium]|uniref:glycosyltransferase family 4 protein n=1 Tax=Azospirillum fermentarium TaxID=1233114 RepID=UPI002226F143|nr:glycosyltransferase family 4 protein [Azospirillum fermentarium]MCW2249608.1 glycosyltransferase involved in cell wall biosynthesis [Azospirillum fermentarium]